MGDFTVVETVLFVWALGASSLASYYMRKEMRTRDELHVAAYFVRRLVEDDKFRNEMRDMFRTYPDSEFHFDTKD